MTKCAQRTAKGALAPLFDAASFAEPLPWPAASQDRVRDRYLAAFKRALPGISAQELGFRLRGLLAVTAVDRIDIDTQRHSTGDFPAQDDAVRRFAITFLAAAMSAPPTRT
ncbi:hypothetical protein [Streptomyces malaysiensis]|uniref:PsrA tetracyclin repressor-like C-terminal domain-containing protein n=1 Tax=Streptomyces malaysiensis subsp. samsunensis TaxID=459658 RepID=A0A9X2LR11_STRMQ|nr:hypothetical protein [Streptomyces samsunensis]MCQ8828052.1 hypothetical protein [Streptomyces samsunensis]